MEPSDAVRGLNFVAYSTKNVLLVVAVMISPSLIESAIIFSQSKLLIYVLGFSLSCC